MDDETIPQYYTLDINEENNSDAFAVQGEVNARTLIVTFFDNGVPINLANCSTVIRFERTDGTSIFNNGTITDEVNGVASYLITSEMAKEAGTFDVVFDIIGESSTKKVVGLTLTVLQGISDSGVQGTNEFTALQTALSQTQSYMSQLQTLIVEVGNAVGSANTAVTNVTQTIIQANSVIAEGTAQINNLKQYYYMNDPSTGLNSYVTTVVTNLYRILMEGKCLTAQAFDALARTASAFDAKNITAYNFDLDSKDLV